jgi:hypothetical protein
MLRLAFGGARALDAGAPVTAIPFGSIREGCAGGAQREHHAGNIAGEVAYLNGRAARPSNGHTVLRGCCSSLSELREWPSPDGQALSRTLAPLEAAAAARLRTWIPKLAYPIREGEHPQTAFSFGLILDWAHASDPALERLLVGKIREFHLQDRDCPIGYEPSGQDFLSPCLGKRTSCGESFRPRSSRPGSTRSSRGCRKMDRAPGYRSASSPTRRTASSRISTA